jgi:pyridoxine 4-dehydrogenase
LSADHLLDPHRGLVELAGLHVSRLGYGTMRLTGPGVFGPPASLTEAHRVIVRALELGVRVFDTAWYYGPDIPNQLLADATRAYAGEVVIATKLGWAYDDRGRLMSAHAPSQLRAGLDHDLRAFGTDAISIVHLRWGDDRSVDSLFAEALTAMIAMRQEGLFRHVGLSNVGLAQLQFALEVTPIVSVSNSFSLADQSDRAVVDFTERHGIAYLPWLPLRVGNARARLVDSWARELGCTPSQVALAWQLQRATNIVPIPGTSMVRHLEENLASLHTFLPEDAMFDLTSSASDGP